MTYDIDQDIERVAEALFNNAGDEPLRGISRGSHVYKDDYRRLALAALESSEAVKMVREMEAEIKRWRDTHKSGDYNPDYCGASEALAEHLKYCNQWQPIETGPKDGTEILGYVPGPLGGSVFTGFYSTTVRGGWNCFNPTGGSHGYDAFTHWMPRPENPKEGE